MKTIEEMREELKQIHAKLTEFKANASFTDEDMAEIKNLNAQAKQLKNDIEAKQLLDGIEDDIVTPVPRKTQAAAPSKPRDNNEHGFSNRGEFYKAVARSTNGNTDRRLQNSTAFEKNAQDGGYLIPSDFRTEIQTVIEGDNSLLGMTRQYRTSSNHLVLPVSETAPWDGSGVEAFWDGEGVSSSESKPRFRQANLRLHKLTALVRVSEELLEDAPALESYIMTEAPKAFVAKTNDAIIDGDGVGKPLGFLKSGFRVTVPKEAAQAADSLVTENIVNMYSRMLPNSISNAFWPCNPAILPQLRLMKFDNGAGQTIPVYMPPTGLAGAPYGTLMGRPVMPMMGGMKALGDEGDIAFVDLSTYITAVKTDGVRSEVSTHVYFDSGETAFRFVMRVAGECPYSAPVKTQYGEYEMSGIVTLQER